MSEHDEQGRDAPNAAGGAEAERPVAPRYDGWKGGLREWVRTNRDRYTPEALTAAAVAAGHPEATVREELARLDDDEAAGPVRARARQIVTWLYIAGFAVLSILMFFNSGSAALLGSGILAISMAVGYAISRLWLRLRISAGGVAGALGVLLLVPVLVWLGLVGLCLATRLPVGGVTV